MFYCIAIGPLPKMVQVCFQYEQVTLGGTVQPEEECPPGPVQSTIRLIDQWVLCHFCWYNLLPGLYRPFRVSILLASVCVQQSARFLFYFEKCHASVPLFHCLLDCGHVFRVSGERGWPHLSSVIPPDKKNRIKNVILGKIVK